ncbi:MAG: class I SAM-dependent methyltransferase [Candidatus Gottesmanbacteria bacterium]
MNSLIKLMHIVIPLSDTMRETWIANELEKIPKGSKILDAGAGESHYQKYCRHLKYISQDLAEYDGRGDDIGISGKQKIFSNIDIVSDITKIPVDSKSFDACLCAEVLEHLPEPLLAIKELSRILKKDGVLILTAPFASLTHYSPYFFYSGFSINFFKKLLPRYDFRIEKINSYGNYFSYLAFELLRIPLVVWRTNKKALPFLIIYPLAIPIYFLLLLFSLFIPSSRELLNFGYCIKARKI